VRSARRGRLAAPLILIAVLLSSCKVDVHLGVRVRDNGSGTVQARFVVDREAVEAVGGDVEGALRVEDLVAAGWEVTVDQGDDGAEVVAQRGFASPEGLTRVVGELSGPEGPFRDFAVSRSRSTFRTSFEFEVVVDMPGGGNHNAPETKAGAPRWAPEVGEVAELRADSSEFELDRVVLVGLGVVLALAAGVTFLRWRRARARAARRGVGRPAPRP